MMQGGYNTSPLNPVPPVVWLLVLPIAAMEIVLSAGDLGLAGGAFGIGWRNDALQRFALPPEMLDQMISLGQYPLSLMQRFLSYPFVHTSFLSAVFAVAMLLALGKFVGDVFSPFGVIAVFIVSTLVAGLVYSAVPGLRLALYGAFPPVYGLIGAFTFIQWARLGCCQRQPRPGLHDDRLPDGDQSAVRPAVRKRPDMDRRSVRLRRGVRRCLSLSAPAARPS